MSTYLEYRARERPRQRESRRQASEAQRKKKTKETFFVGRTTRKFCSAGDQLSQGNLFSSKSEKKAFKNDLDYTETEQTRETIQVMRSLNKVYTPS